MSRKHLMRQGTALIRAMDPEPLANIPAHALWASQRDKRFFEYMIKKGLVGDGQAERQGA